jgi:hypothetical protein
MQSHCTFLPARYAAVDAHLARIEQELAAIAKEIQSVSSAGDQNGPCWLQAATARNEVAVLRKVLAECQRAR